MIAKFLRHVLRLESRKPTGPVRGPASDFVVVDEIEGSICARLGDEFETEWCDPWTADLTVSDAWRQTAPMFRDLDAVNVDKAGSISHLYRPGHYRAADGALRCAACKGDKSRHVGTHPSDQ